MTLTGVWGRFSFFHPRFALADRLLSLPDPPVGTPVEISALASVRYPCGS
jgi:hypothetical protein